MSHSNLLITSISKKAPLIKSIRSAAERSELVSQLYGADSDGNCTGRYFVDAFWEMPLLEKLKIEDLLVYCREHRIAYIIPTRDGELAFFATHKKSLLEHGIAVMVSDLPGVTGCLDKLQFFRQVSSLGFPVIQTSEASEKIDSSLYVVKERYGAGSRRIGLRLTKDQALEHARHLQDPVFQPYISGQEASVDLYIDRNGKTKGAVARLRQLVIDGESRITSTIHNDELEALCSDVAQRLHLYGHVIFQVLIDAESRFHIIECNPRFGGASTLSIAVGLDSFYWFILESSGMNLEDYPFRRSPVEKTQIRYAEDLII